MNLESRIKNKNSNPRIRLVFAPFLILGSIFLIPRLGEEMSIANILPKRAWADVGEVKLELPHEITADQSNYGVLVIDIIQLVFAFLAAMALAGIVYSGVMMITAGGDASKFAAGKKNLIWAIIGIIVAVLSYFILQFAAQFFNETIG